MEKEKMIHYIEMLNKRDESGEYYPTPEEQLIIQEILEKSNEDPTFKEWIEKIKSAPLEERFKVLEEYYLSQKEEKTEEETIAQVFGVSIDKVQHKYLENGKEIFAFYDERLQREILLENEAKGTTLKERLLELQQEQNDFQTKDEEKNTHNILMNERNTKDLELEMHTKDEIKNHPDLLSNLDHKTILIVNYLIDHYEDLNIKSINLDNCIYLDNNNEIFEVTMNNDKEITVSSPKDEKSSTKSFQQEEVKEDDLSNMLEEQEKEEEEKEDEELEEEKPKVLIRGSDGYTYKPYFVAAISLVIIIGIFYLIMIW